MPFIMIKAESSSPGKLILAGEHVVLYGYKALAFPINKNTKVLVQDSNHENTIKIYLKNFNKILQVTKSRVHRINLKDKNTLITLRTLKFFFERFHVDINNGLDLFVNSQIPIGGFGSSTSVSASILKAFFKMFNIEVKDKDLIDYVIEIESINGIKVSGLDQTVIVENSPISFIKKGEINSYKKIYPKNKYIKNCVIIDTGRPNEVTGEVVKFIKEQYNSDYRNIKIVFDNIGKYCSILERFVQESDTLQILDIISSIGEELVKLKIVTPYCQDIISDLKKLGASSKISGAGAITGNGCGALICFTNNTSPVIKYLDSRNIKYFITNLF